MKVFISQPMKGLTDEQIKEVRAKACAKAENCIRAIRPDCGKIEFIDSFIKGAPDGASPLYYLGKSIELLARADAIFVCYGWMGARGCEIERQVAYSYNVPIIIEENKYGVEISDREKLLREECVESPIPGCDF